VPTQAVRTCVFIESPASSHTRVHYRIAARLRSADI
jgi:hypothetical protein